MSKVIWQKAALPTCHPSRRRIDSSAIHGSMDPHESAPQTGSRSVQPFFVHSSPACPAYTHTQTTLRATSVATGHTYVLRACDAMRPDNKSASPRHLLKTFSLLDCSNVRESYKIGIELNLIEGLSGCAREFCTTSLNTSYSNCLFENCTTIIITIITLLCTRQ